MAIPKCKYLIRKGEKPCPRRSNIFDWTPVLAEKVEKFEQLKEALPPIVEPPLSPYQNPPPPPVVEVKKILIAEAIKKLEKEDFTAAGVPKIAALQDKTGIEINKYLRDEAFAYYKSEIERKGRV